MKWVDCQRYCIGQCPCPDPPWLWKCNRVPPTPKKRDPQKVLKGAYLRSLPYDIWNGDLL